MLVVTSIKFDEHLAVFIKAHDLVEEGSILNELLLFKIKEIILLLEAELEDVLLVFVVVFEALFVPNQVPHIVLVVHE